MKPPATFGLIVILGLSLGACGHGAQGANRTDTASLRQPRIVELWATTNPRILLASLDESAKDLKGSCSRTYAITAERGALGTIAVTEKFLKLPSPPAGMTACSGPGDDGVYQEVLLPVGSRGLKVVDTACGCDVKVYGPLSPDRRQKATILPPSS